MLKMEGYDLGWSHAGGGSGTFDGGIDTWVCGENWACE